MGKGCKGRRRTKGISSCFFLKKRGREGGCEPADAPHSKRRGASSKEEGW